MEKWQICAFTELTVEQLYQILKLRQEVFVLEQNCPYVDTDNLDQLATHIIAWHKTTPEPTVIAYVRILPPGAAYEEASIGRVVTHPEFRKLGLGKKIMRKGIQLIHESYPNFAIRISAQKYLEKFYAAMGFKTVSDPYLEDNIPHVEMLLEKEDLS